MFGILLILPVVLLKFGKKSRLWTQERYTKMAMKQPTYRTF